VPYTTFSGILAAIASTSCTPMPPSVALTLQPRRQSRASREYCCGDAHRHRKVLEERGRNVEAARILRAKGSDELRGLEHVLRYRQGYRSHDHQHTVQLRSCWKWIEPCGKTVAVTDFQRRRSWIL
jgi:hypothetical protein